MKSLLLWKEDLSKFDYFMSDKQRQSHGKNKFICAMYPLIALVPMAISGDFANVWLMLLGCLACTKIPYVLLILKHNQNCNDVVNAIPLWMNHIYALIEKNTIHNAIVNSSDDNTPLAIKHDLEMFIKKIEKQTDDKSAYLDFLARYNIDGFSDIMLKLYEYRNLSKDRLKYEIKNLNKDLGKLEALKRRNQFKNELFIGDTCTCFIIFIPCIYMTVISLMPSLFTV